MAMHVGGGRAGEVDEIKAMMTAIATKCWQTIRIRSSSAVWHSGHQSCTVAPCVKIIVRIERKSTGHAVSEGQKPSNASTTTQHQQKTIGSIKMKNKKKMRIKRRRTHNGMKLIFRIFMNYFIKRCCRHRTHINIFVYPPMGSANKNKLLLK